MDTPVTTCIRCGENMEEGFIVDFADNDNPVPSRWVPGVPEKLTMGGAAWSNKKCHGVRAYRCTGCGALEFFADAEPWAKPDKH